MRLPIIVAAGLATLAVAGPAGAAETRSYSGAHPHTFSSAPGGLALADNALTVASIPAEGYGELLTAPKVALRGLTHPFPDDLDIQLVAPVDRQTILMSDAGGAAALADRDLLFTADATKYLPDGVAPAADTPAWAPTNHGSGDLWGPNCTTSGIWTTLKNLAGTSGEHDWRLCVRDDTQGQQGSLDGWDVTATTSGFRAPATGTTGIASAYPATTEVGPAADPVRSVRVRMTMDAADSNDLDVLLVSPRGTAVTLMSDAGGDTNLNGEIVFDQAAPPFAPATTNAPQTFRPTNLGAGEDAYGVTPANGHHASLDAFVGEPAQGTWKLYVHDDESGGTAAVERWSLELTTGPNPPAPAPAPTPTAPAPVAPAPAPRAVPAARAQAKLALGKLRPTVKRGRVRVKFTLSAAARVTLTLERRHGKRHRRVTSTTASGRRGGNTVALPRKLKPGTYRLTATAGSARRTATVRVR